MQRVQFFVLNRILNNLIYQSITLRLWTSEISAIVTTYDASPFNFQNDNLNQSFNIFRESSALYYEFWITN